MKLREAHEIASDRIIASKYARDIEKEELKRKKKEKERLSSLPDFVVAWELSQKEDSGFGSSSLEDPEIVEDIEKNPTTFIHTEKITSKIIEQEDARRVIVQEPETITINDPIEIHWYGHFTSYSGFSRMNRAMVFGLANRNVKVKVDMQRCAIDVNQTTYNELKRLESTEVSPSAPKIYGATVPLSMCHGGKKILYTMIENDETLHPDYVGKLNLFDEIWVPTHHGEKMFKKNGVRPRIIVMPLGVEISRYHSKVEPFNMGDVCSFRFISVFKWGFRKGYDILLKAYMEEFSSQDDVSLILVSRSDTDNNPNRIAEDFKAIRMGIDKKDEDLPHVSLYDKNIPEKDMPSIYKAGNAFVLISRGEGYCLTIAEAASCGLPVIAANCSGPTDYLTEENSYLVNPDGFIKASVNGQLSKLAKHCYFYENQIFPDFGPIAIEKTKEHMRYVYENYDKSLKKAAILQKDIRSNYSWEKSVGKVYDRIREIV